MSCRASLPLSFNNGLGCSSHPLDWIFVRHKPEQERLTLLEMSGGQAVIAFRCKSLFAINIIAVNALFTLSTALNDLVMQWPDCWRHAFFAGPCRMHIAWNALNAYRKNRYVLTRLPGLPTMLQATQNIWKPTVIAVIVPAHNEEDQIVDCIAALRVAARCPHLCGEPTLVIVVLDACTDGTRNAVQQLGVTVISTDARNVGAARALGAQLALAAGARWLAFTDADTQVGPNWLCAQLAQNSDAVCGTVAVKDWGTYGEAMRTHYAATYNDADGHRHVHGANFGISAEAYEHTGGFQNLESSEDVALVEALESNGLNIAWSAAPRVFTSSRRQFRAPGGFGATLARVEQESAQNYLDIIRT